MGKLTTHVLDTAHGRPAAGVAIALFRVSGVRREAVGHAATNADGRCAAPLLEGAALVAGVYELDFAIGDYYAALGMGAAQARTLARNSFEGSFAGAARIAAYRDHLDDYCARALA